MTVDVKPYTFKGGVSPFQSATDIIQKADAKNVQQVATQNIKKGLNLTGPVSDTFLHSKMAETVETASNGVLTVSEQGKMVAKNAVKKQGFFSKIAGKVKNSKAFNFVKKHKVACAIGAAAVATGAVIAGVVAHNKKKTNKA